MIPIYPDYEYQVSKEYLDAFKYEYAFRCQLRLLHDDGKYYLTRMVFRCTSKDFESAVKMFIRQAYIYIKFYKVDPEVSPMGYNLFQLDHSQISEEERLKLIP